MKQSHYTTPRTMDESNFYYVGYSRRTESEYQRIDLVIYLFFLVVLFSFLAGYFS